MGTLISWNPLGHSRPVTGLLLYLYKYIGSCITVYTVMGCHVPKDSPFKAEGILMKAIRIKNYDT